MKTMKHLLIAALALSCLTGASAQSNFGEFRWGLKGGVNFANVSNLNNLERDKGKVGIVGGGFVKIPLNSYLSIRPELLFNMKGASVNIPTDVVGQIDKGRFALNYVELPVSLDFDLPFFLDFHAGLQGAFLLSKKIEINGDKKENHGFNNGEVGWHIGTGIDLGNIGIQVRFQQSLTSFYDVIIDGAGDVKPRNWGISLTGSYMFVN